MKLLLRISSKSEKFDKTKVKNTFYQSSKYTNITIYPLPEFIGEKPICGWCGKEAVMMDNDFVLLCSECLNTMLGETKLCNKEEYKAPNLEDFFKKQRVEWCIAGKDNWYIINARNIIPDSYSTISPEEIDRRYHRIVVSMLNGGIESVDGEYDKDKKQMKVYL